MVVTKLVRSGRRYRGAQSILTRAHRANALCCRNVGSRSVGFSEESFVRCAAVAHGEDQFVVIDHGADGPDACSRGTSWPSSAPAAWASSPERLSVFELYLSLWVGLCMLLDVVLRLTTFRAFDVAGIT
jgi:hypothetical protein